MTKKTIINAGAFCFNELFEAAAKLDQLGINAPGQAADELFANAQGLRNVAGIMAANMMITLAGAEAPSVEEINKALVRFNKVLGKIKKIEQGLAMATAVVAFLGALMTGQGIGILKSFNAMKAKSKEIEAENKKEGKGAEKKEEK